MSTTIATSIGNSKDSHTLGKTIAAEAKRKLGNETPDIVLVFASEHQDHERLLLGVREITGDTPMIGSCAGGGFTEEDHSSDGAVCALIKSDTHRFSIGMGEGLKNNVDDAIRQATTQLRLAKISEYPHCTAMMLMDVEAGRGEKAVSAASRLLGPDITIAGGAGRQIFYNGKAYLDAVAFCALHSKARIRMTATHGHFPFGDIMTVTKVKDERIYEIDGKNAWEVWKEVTRERREESGFTDKTLEDQACHDKFFPHFESGLMTDQGQYKLRAIIGKYPDGSLSWSTIVPEGTKFRMMHSDRPTQLALVERAAKLAKIYAVKNKVAGALIFDCLCRNVILDTDYYNSIREFNNVLEETPLIGFVTFGEICTESTQLTGFLNTACVVLIIPD